MGSSLLFFQLIPQHPYSSTIPAQNPSSILKTSDSRPNVPFCQPKHPTSFLETGPTHILKSNPNTLNFYPTQHADLVSLPEPRDPTPLLLQPPITLFPRRKNPQKNEKNKSQNPASLPHALSLSPSLPPRLPHAKKHEGELMTKQRACVCCCFPLPCLLIRFVRRNSRTQRVSIVLLDCPCS